jgi:F-box interacting protein
MYGFGHDPILDNYKVVVILHASSSSSSLVAKTYAMVYTLGATSSSWEIIESPFGGIAAQQRSGKFVNGTINWLVSKMYPTKRQHFIASFDLRNESYQELWLPPNCGGAVNVSSLYLAALGVLRDCLCMVFRHDV